MSTQPEVTWDDLVIGPRERMILIGGTQVGKSTAEAQILASVRAREPKSLHLILDSKPRFRAEWTLTGIKKRYRGMDHGELIPGSVLVEDPKDLDLAIARGYTVMICQVKDQEHANPKRLTWMAQHFFEKSRSKVLRYLWVDEILDFFTVNGQAKTGSAPSIQAVARAGAERGMGLVVCSQRTKGVPPEIISMMSKLLLFMLDNKDDVKHLSWMGAPANLEAPDDNYEFYFWDKAHRKRPPELLTITLPKKSGQKSR